MEEIRKAAKKIERIQSDLGSVYEVLAELMKLSADGNLCIKEPEKPKNISLMIGDDFRDGAEF